MSGSKKEINNSLHAIHDNACLKGTREPIVPSDWLGDAPLTLRILTLNYRRYTEVCIAGFGIKECMSAPIR